MQTRKYSFIAGSIPTKIINNFTFICVLAQNRFQYENPCDAMSNMISWAMLRIIKRRWHQQQKQYGNQTIQNELKLEPCVTCLFIHWIDVTRYELVLGFRFGSVFGLKRGEHDMASFISLFTHFVNVQKKQHRTHTLTGRWIILKIAVYIYIIFGIDGSHRYSSARRSF